jgi:glutamate decarboxylase
VITPEEAVERIDDNTIGVVAILGTTYTGEFEPIREIHDAVVAHNEETGRQVPVHVDAASGGFVAPFLHPDLEWDFRLPMVKSINVSGHKYGLVYPGVGFVVWREAADLPEDLVFHVNYLGGDMPTFTLNFSRPGNQIVGQYYNFLRLGRSGYTRIMRSLRDLAVHTSAGIARLGPFELVSDGTAIPVLSFALKDPSPYTVFDVSERLRVGGWQVPAYTMPEAATGVAVMRVVVREGFSEDLADALVDALKDATDYLDANPPKVSRAPAAFSH